MKKWSLCLLLLAAFPSHAFGYFVVTKEPTQVYEKQNGRPKAIGSVSKGYRFEVLKRGKAWYVVNYRGKSAYVQATKIDDEGGSRAPASHQINERAYTTRSRSFELGPAFGFVTGSSDIGAGAAAFYDPAFLPEPHKLDFGAYAYYYFIGDAASAAAGYSITSFGLLGVARYGYRIMKGVYLGAEAGLDYTYASVSGSTTTNPFLPAGTSYSDSLVDPLLGALAQIQVSDLISLVAGFRVSGQPLIHGAVLFRF